MSPTLEPYLLEPLPAFREFPQPEMVERARAFHGGIARRRTVCDFHTRTVPRQVVELCLLTADTAPLGANQQPLFFGVITGPEHKSSVHVWCLPGRAAVCWSTTDDADLVAGEYAIGDLNPGNKQQGH
jgi:hypothetical protein